MSEYGFEVSYVDVAVALECERDRATREGFPGVAKRQDDAALHLRNAMQHMETHCPEGMRPRFRLVIDYVPDVNAVYRGDFRR